MIGLCLTVGSAGYVRRGAPVPDPSSNELLGTPLGDHGPYSGNAFNTLEANYPAPWETVTGDLVAPLLSRAERLAVIGKAAPDIASHLPLRFEEGLSSPCFRDANSTRRCLPAFFVAGAMQCAASDLWRRLQTHGQIPSTHDALSHWWTNHPRSRAGGFARYYERLSGPRTLAVLEGEPRALLGEASPATFTYIMAESLRLHYLYLDAFAKCHGRCRSRSPPPAFAKACALRTYDEPYPSS